MYEGYFFVGGDFDLSEGRSWSRAGLPKASQLPLRPHPRRPLVKG